MHNQVLLVEVYLAYGEQSLSCRVHMPQLKKQMLLQHTNIHHPYQET